MVAWFGACPIFTTAWRPHLPFRKRRGRIHFCQIPLEAENGIAIGSLGRGAEKQRRGRRPSPPDLRDAIDWGDFPEWDLGVQLFDPAFADGFAFDVLDPTKLIPEEDCPVQIIGTMKLDRAENLRRRHWQSNDRRGKERVAGEADDKQTG